MSNVALFSVFITVRSQKRSSVCAALHLFTLLCFNYCPAYRKQFTERSGKVLCLPVILIQFYNGLVGRLFNVCFCFFNVTICVKSTQRTFKSTVTFPSCLQNNQVERSLNAFCNCNYKRIFFKSLKNGILCVHTTFRNRRMFS